MEQTLTVEFTREELLQLSLSVACRIGVVQTRWASGIKDETENTFLIGLMQRLNNLSIKLDNQLKEFDEAEERTKANGGKD